MTERVELKPCKCGLCGSENTEPLRGLTHCNDCMGLSEVMTMPSKIWAGEVGKPAQDGKCGLWREAAGHYPVKYIRADIAEELARALAKMDHLGADQIIALDRYHAATKQTP